MKIRLGILFVALPSLLAPQAAVEAALGAGRAATSAAPAQKAGKAVAGAFDNLNRTLQESEKPKPAAGRKTPAPKKTTPAGRRATSAAVKPNSSTTDANVVDVFEDPSGIQEGMDYVAITRRFGLPSLKLMTGPGEETLCYARKGLSVDVTIRDGKAGVVKRSGEPDRPTGITIK